MLPTSSMSVVRKHFWTDVSRRDGGCVLAQEVGLERLHAGRRQEHRRVERGGDERRGRHDGVPALGEVVGEALADLVGRHHGAHASPILRGEASPEARAENWRKSPLMLQAVRADAGTVRLRAIQGDARKLADDGPPPLRRACGHVAGDPALVRRGYRYYRGFGLDLGGFLTRRFTLEDGRGASVTLVAGIDIESGAGMLEHCTSTAQAARELRAAPPASGRSSSRWRTRRSPGRRAQPASDGQRPVGVRRVRRRADRAAAAS